MPDSQDRPAAPLRSRRQPPGRGPGLRRRRRDLPSLPQAAQQSTNKAASQHSLSCPVRLQVRPDPQSAPHHPARFSRQSAASAPDSRARPARLHQFRCLLQEPVLQGFRQRLALRWWP
jgi:hypothetical protein